MYIFPFKQILKAPYVQVMKTKSKNKTNSTELQRSHNCIETNSNRGQKQDLCIQTLEHQSAPRAIL